MKINCEKISDDFIRGMFAGGLISLSCCGYAMSGNILFGAVLFAVGLLIIKHCNLRLFTGVIGRFKDFADFGCCIVVFASNIVGCFITALAVLAIYPDDLNLFYNLAEIGNKKIDFSLVYLLVMGIFCGFIMFYATKTDISELLTIFCIALFIIAGFEHSIADCFYMLFADGSIGIYFLKISIIAIGNGIGANIPRLIEGEIVNV